MPFRQDYAGVRHHIRKTNNKGRIKLGGLALQFWMLKGPLHLSFCFPLDGGLCLCVQKPTLGHRPF